MQQVIVKLVGYYAHYASIAPCFPGPDTLWHHYKCTSYRLLEQAQSAVMAIPEMVQACVQVWCEIRLGYGRQGLRGLNR